MARLSKHKQSIRKVTEKRERQRKVGKVQEGRGLESDVEEDVAAPAARLLQRSADRNQERSVSDSATASDLDSKFEEPENDEVLVNGGEKLELRCGIVSLILSSATGAEQNGLQEKTVGLALKQ